MNKKLLIVGAGTYALLAYEIACDMKQFEQIDFVDDQKPTSPIGTPIIGRTSELTRLANDYTDIAVAIGDASIRLPLLDRIEKETALSPSTLISPRAYVSPSAKIAQGVIIEPFAAVHAMCDVRQGCIISAGAVINHDSVCEEGCHIDCNATVPGYVTVPAGTVVPCGTVYASEPPSHL